MRRILPVLSFVLFSLPSFASGPLPGFRVEQIATSNEFITSLAVDSQGTVYFTTHTSEIDNVPGRGDLYRLVNGEKRLVATFPTSWEGNAGLLGVALVDDGHAVVHYTTPGRCQHVIASVDLATGTQNPIKVMDVIDRCVSGESVSTEHHGGNLTVAPDGAVWFGIGDFGTRVPAQDPASIGGKVWRLSTDGVLTKWASGLRNPYDLAWDPDLGRIVITDNGALGHDEVNVVAQGDDCGWPNETLPDGRPAVAPVYTFRPGGNVTNSVAPTGLLRVNGRNPIVRRGYIVAGFVTRSLYYFPSITTAPADDPITILDRAESPIIDVVDGPDGTIYFCTSAVTSKIFRLDSPKRGDCNGDGLMNTDDLVALDKELQDGASQPMVTVGGGSYAASWGCDANADSLVNAADADAIRALLNPRTRAVRRR